MHRLVATAEAAIQTYAFTRARDTALTKGLWLVGGEGNCLMLWTLRPKEKKRKNWHDAAQVRPAAAVQIKSERGWLAPIEHVHLGLPEQQQQKRYCKAGGAEKRRRAFSFFSSCVCVMKRRKRMCMCVLICVLPSLQRWHAEA